LANILIQQKSAQRDANTARSL